MSLESPKAVAPMAQALREAAEWVGCDSVRVERVDRPELTAALAAAVTLNRRAGARPGLRLIQGSGSSRAPADPGLRLIRGSGWPFT
ncbi:hypothetical protein SANTM175S_01062 [Streptomyces antimycoticus]